MRVCRPRGLWLVFCGIVVLSGCAGMQKSAPPLAFVAGGQGHYGIGRILDLDAGTSVSFDALTDRIGAKDLVFVGEVHDNPEHHLIEVQILQRLLACCRPLAIAMEFFEQEKQEILDRYVGGEIDEEEFLKAVDWANSWGFDYSLYRPLLLLARQNRCRVLAINAPRRVVREVARKGLAGLDESDRKKIARDIDLSNKPHRAYLLDIYKEHSHGNLQSFEYFYEAQCVWEDTMARNIAEYMRNKKGKVIVFSGNGHIRYKYGIPDRVEKRLPVSMVTVMPYVLEGHEVLPNGIADYVWLTAGYPHRMMMSRN